MVSAVPSFSTPTPVSTVTTALRLRCADLVTADELTRTFTRVLAPTAPSRRPDGAGPGALLCAWGDGDGALEVALDPSGTGVGGAPLATCDDDRCAWDVHVENARLIIASFGSALSADGSPPLEVRALYSAVAARVRHATP